MKLRVGFGWTKACLREWPRLIQIDRRVRDAGCGINVDYFQVLADWTRCEIFPAYWNRGLVYRQRFKLGTGQWIESEYSQRSLNGSTLRRIDRLFEDCFLDRSKLPRHCHLRTRRTRVIAERLPQVSRGAGCRRERFSQLPLVSVGKA